MVADKWAEERLAYWKSRLGLGPREWNIELCIRDAEIEADVEIKHKRDGVDQARIQISRQQPREKFEHELVHELLHVLLAPLSNRASELARPILGFVMDSTGEDLDWDGFTTLQADVKAEEQIVVETLTKALCDRRQDDGQESNDGLDVT